MLFNRSFTLGVGGYKIFLSSDDQQSGDEYSGEDPYGVEDNLNSPFHQRRFEITLKMVEVALTGGSGSILDLGCGQGHITQFIHEHCPSSKICGLDYSVSAIQYANSKFPGIEFVVANAMDAPFAIAQFDIIVCNNLWEHVPDPMRLLSGIKAMLKPGGYVIISTPSRYRTSNLFRALLGRPLVMMSPHHVTEYTLGQVKEQLSFGGFHVVKVASRSIRSNSWKRAIASALAKSAVAMIGSHHQLDETVFYLAQVRD